MSSVQKAFTLIELLVVIAVIGLLSAIVLVSVTGTREKARIAKASDFSKTMDHSIGAYAAGRWGFNEGSGGTTIDASGYNNNGTLANGPTWTTDTPSGKGNALNFDGSNDYMNAGQNPVLDFGTGDFSVGFWIKASGNTLNRILVSKGNGDNLEAGWRVNTDANGKSYLRISDGSNQANSTSLSYQDGKWHHMAFTVDRDNTQGMKAYLDGVLIGATNPSAVTGSISRSTLSLILMANPNGGGGWYNGIIDEFNLYSSALGITQIEKIYAKGLTNNELILE